MGSAYLPAIATRFKMESSKQDNKPFSSHLVDTATVANHSKLWLYVVCFNSQFMKRIAYFGNLNLGWDFKISLNFTICLLCNKN